MLFLLFVHLGLPAEGAKIEGTNPGADLLPRNLVDLALALFLEVREQRLVGTDGVDGVSEGVDVPVVDIDAVGQNLGTA